jgi:hypothetical protein
VGEHDVEEVLGLALPARSRDVRAPAVHLRRALRTSCRQNETPDERRSHERDLLGDESADREAEQVDLLEAERGDEGDDLPRRLGNRVARPSGRGTDTRIVDEDDLALAGDRVGQRRVLVVEIAAEVLQASRAGFRP